MRPRLIVLCLVTLALLAAAGWTGILGLLWTADRVHSAPIIGGVVVMGLCFAWLGNWKWVKRCGILFPLFGLALTSYGILVTYPEVLAGGDYNTIRAHTMMALTPNCIAGVCLAWLTIVRWVCEP